MKYVLIDTANMFFRARHGAFKASDTWTKLGFALHVTMMAANKVATRFKADHVVFALEGRSWRKDFYEPYKKNRAVARAALTSEITALNVIGRALEAKTTDGEGTVLAIVKLNS